MRQLTPDSAAFIQQSQQQQPTTQPTTTLTAVMLSGSIYRPAGKTTATVTSTLQQPVVSVTQPTQVGVGKQGQPTQVVGNPSGLLSKNRALPFLKLVICGDKGMYTKYVTVPVLHAHVLLINACNLPFLAMAHFFLSQKKAVLGGSLVLQKKVGCVRA